MEGHADVLYRWEWRGVDGTYTGFAKEQCVHIETCWRKKQDSAVVWGRGFPVAPSENLKCIIDFGDMTAMVAGSEWVTAIRRWDKNEPMGESWDHQVDEVAIVKVEREWVDYAVAASAFYDRKRGGGRKERVSRDTHRIVQVRRIQNRRQLDMFKAERKSMEGKRGQGRVELTTKYAWHGSGNVRPDSIAAGDGFMMQVRAGRGGWWAECGEGGGMCAGWLLACRRGCVVAEDAWLRACERGGAVLTRGGGEQYGNSEGFYLQGSYTAEQVSYSHHERYVYRSSDVEGERPDKGGKYFHLLLVNVLRGEPLKTSEVWRGQGFGFVKEKLGKGHDSVEGGPHRPTRAGPGEDDSLIYVVYHPSQVLPEFIVTYTEVDS